MAWQIEWSDEATRDIVNLERDTAERIIRKLDQVTEDPYRYFERIVGSDEFKLRVGDYRVIVLLANNSKTIFIKKAGHRKNIYKKK
jgi:mRNA interferase RelE/StbE